MAVGPTNDDLFTYKITIYLLCPHKGNEVYYWNLLEIDS